MARYLGSVNRKAKKWNFSILETGKDLIGLKTKTKQRGYSKPKTEYGEQLIEKQKLRFRYFIPDKQLKNLFIKVTKMDGKKDDNLIKLIELRLDNCVYRSGIAATRKEARQLVSHNHIVLNGKKANIPSMIVSVGDVITIKKNHMKKSPKIQKNLKNQKTYSFIDKNIVKMEFKITDIPNLEELPQDINMPKVIEFYNRFL